MLPGVILLVEEVQYQEKEEEEKLKQDCEVGQHIFKEHSIDDRVGKSSSAHCTDKDAKIYT